MSDPQTNAGRNNRIQVRLPESLMRHVEFRAGKDGLYVDSSDYIRDLIRQDALLYNDPKESLYELLAKGVTADEESFRQTSLQDIKKRAEEFFG